VVIGGRGGNFGGISRIYLGHSQDLNTFLDFSAQAQSIGTHVRWFD
jgi:hypothetical protein